MTSEVADSVSIREALNIYVRSLKANNGNKPSRSKADVSAKPIDHKALFDFVQYFDRRTLASLTPAEIGGYAERVNGNGTTPGATERLQCVKDFLSYAKKVEDLTSENLARYVRIRKTRTRSDTIALSSQPQAIELTAEGHTQLQAQLERLLTEDATLAQDIRKARADGDVSENFPLDAAREEKGRVEARIQEIRSTLNNSVIIDESQARSAHQVKIGTVVEVVELGRERTMKYMLVNGSEANPLEKRISDASPMGIALLGRRVKDEVVVETPRGKVRYRIASIS